MSGDRSSPYRRMLRWYPKAWRRDNEDALLGILLDKAESDGRVSPTFSERAGVARAGVAQRLFIPASASPFTLLIGGIGIVLATINPLIGEAVFTWPAPDGLSFLNDSWQSFPKEISAGILTLAFAVLAIGIGRESGIAGRSLLGKILLVLFPAPNLAIQILDSTPLRVVGTPVVGDSDLFWAAAWCCVLVSFVALVGASVFVARARVLRGPARWALTILAGLAGVTIALEQLPNVVGQLSFEWGYPLQMIVQLLMGAAFIWSGRAVGTARRSSAGRPTA